MSWQEFNDRVVATLERQLLLQIVAHATYAPDFVLKEHYIIQYVPKKYSILTLSLANAFKNVKGKPLSDAELSHTLRVKAIVMLCQQNGSGIAWTSTQLLTVFLFRLKRFRLIMMNHKNISYVQEPAKVEVRRILFKVAHGVRKMRHFQKLKKL